jgi:hypothetical protein
MLRPFLCVGQAVTDRLLTADEVAEVGFAGRVRGYLSDGCACTAAPRLSPLRSPSLLPILKRAAGAPPCGLPGQERLAVEGRAELHKARRHWVRRLVRPEVEHPAQVRYLEGLEGDGPARADVFEGFADFAGDVRSEPEVPKHGEQGCAAVPADDHVATGEGDRDAVEAFGHGAERT